MGIQRCIVWRVCLHAVLWCLRLPWAYRSRTTESVGNSVYGWINNNNNDDDDDENSSGVIIGVIFEDMPFEVSPPFSENPIWSASNS
jgi:hypothetical protein